MNTIEQLKSRFVERFGGDTNGVRVFRAPGRVNLIGEHTDYNGGYVFPAALSVGTTMLVRRRDDSVIRLASENFQLEGEVNPAHLPYRDEDDWMNYPKAMLFILQQKGHRSGGYDILYDGAIPNGSGLSSSASILVVTGFGLLAMEGEPVDRVELAKMAQEAENRYLGVNCGIMDPFAIAMGKENHAIRLLCRTLEYEHVPFHMADYRLVIGNTKKRRGLVDSAYNERRAQCEQAVRQLMTVIPGLTHLAELDSEQLQRHEHVLTDEAVRKRAQHVVAEHERVIQSVQALHVGRLDAFGKRMIQSHESLRDLYEVSCRELDVMVEAALECEGVLGSRMTGAGFGGCTVTLVHRDRTEAMIETVGTKYKNQTGLNPEFYTVEIGDGVREIEDGD